MTATSVSTEDTLAAVISAGRAGCAVAVVGCRGSRRARGVLALMAQFATPGNLEALLACAAGEPMLAMESSRWERLGRPGCRFPADPEALAASIQGAVAAGVDDRRLAVEQLPIAFRTAAGGVLDRPEPEEGAVDLARLANLQPAAVVCPFEIADATALGDGEMTLPGGERVPYVSVTDLLRHRTSRVVELERAVTVDLPTRYGDFTMVGYDSSVELIGVPVALVKGEVEGGEEVPLYVHRSCLFGDALYSRACDCAERIRTVLSRLGAGGRGVIVRLSSGTLEGCDPDARLDELDRTIVSRVLAELGIRSTVPMLK
jgi:3,4-dihydroxy 2-butanone 4-phosphate synthase/GTP cyclohydrolase II